MKRILLGAVLGFVLAAAAVAGAAPGDWTYEADETVEVSAAVASAAAVFASNNCSWGGSAAEMNSVVIYRDEASATGFACRVTGKRTAAPAAVPNGVRLISQAP